MEVLLKNQPEGVQLSVKEVSQQKIFSMKMLKKVHQDKNIPKQIQCIYTIHLI